MRRIIIGIAVVLMGAGCANGTPGSDDPAIEPEAILVQPSASPYSEITAGAVQALVPDGWQARPAGSALDSRAGFFASPRPHAWERRDRARSGVADT